MQIRILSILALFFFTVASQCPTENNIGGGNPNTSSGGSGSNIPESGSSNGGAGSGNPGGESGGGAPESPDTPNPPTPVKPLGRQAIVLLGPVASGKTTQAELLAKSLNMPIIEWQALLNWNVASGNALGLKAKSIMTAGSLLPTDLIIDMILERLQKPDTQKGVLLDGFPRTLEWVNKLQERLKEKVQWLAIEIQLSDKKLFNRVAAVTDREDYKPVTVHKRLQLYNERRKDLLGYYRNEGVLTELDGDRPREDVFKDIMDAYKKRFGS